MELDELIKELDKKLIVTSKEIKDGIMYIYCETAKQNTKCKYCGSESENVHSTYTRVISDLPIQNYKVKLVINVNVNSFCSFLAKKYVGFWQRFIRGGIFPLFIVFLYLKMLLLNYQQMLLR